MTIKLRHLMGAAIFTAAFTMTAALDDPKHYESGGVWEISYQYEDGCNDWHNAEYDAYMFECDGVFYESIDEYEALHGGR